MVEIPKGLMVRSRDVARVQIGYACHDMDVRPMDREPDGAEWRRVELSLARLLAAAYVRNHTP